MKFFKLLLLTTSLMTVQSALAKNDDIAHNWTSDSEAAAMKVFADKFESLGGTWKEVTSGSREDSILAAKTRVLGGNPSAAVQQIIGGETADWDRNGMSANLDDLVKKQNWAGKLSPSMMKQIKTGPHYSSVPVFVDVVNFLYSNTDVLKSAGVNAVPSTWDGFVASLDKIKASGKTPLALGGDSWQLAILYDHVALSILNGDEYGKVVDGDMAIINSNKVLEVFKRIAMLRDNYIDIGQPGRSFPDTLSMVVKGDAGYNFMGGWGAGFFNDKNANQWACTITPWASESLTLVDGFLFIKGGDKATQAMLAEALLDKDAQQKASMLKGSIPAVQGVDISSLSGCTAVAAKSLQSNDSVTHWNAKATDNKTVLKDVLADFFANKMSAEDGQKELAKKMGML